MRISEKNLGTTLIVVLFFAYLFRVYFPSDNLLFPNSDFEAGTLYNWDSQGFAGQIKAFDRQPTYGDNPWYRNSGSAHPVGDYWIGSYENRRRVEEPRGGFQGEAPIGKLASTPFVIRKNKIKFRVGGGNSSDQTGVALEIEGKRVLFERGKGILIDGEQMRPVVWDVSKWKGMKAFVVIVDESSFPWGHINADDFRYS